MILMDSLKLHDLPFGPYFTLRILKHTVGFGPNLKPWLLRTQVYLILLWKRQKQNSNVSNHLTAIHIFIMEFSWSTKEGELIGDGGVHQFTGTLSGWPEFGYKFKKEHWGLGFATEFAKAFMTHWWNNLPRDRREIAVVSATLDIEVSSETSEQVCAWTKKGNEKSERVLEKVGFQKFQGLENGFTNWRLTKDLFEKKRKEEV
uniref:N-acetyl-transferase n=1 Tax=Pestalotiopsis fici TaxID=393283 RepID=A0A1D8RE25_9PEZI|nr:N-acetyl-transferase [Pestalotiopsis fici]AOW71168.1 N-acetyl-transferase [Pestalotiopsis fici]